MEPSLAAVLDGPLLSSVVLEVCSCPVPTSISCAANVSEAASKTAFEIERLTRNSIMFLLQGEIVAEIAAASEVFIREFSGVRVLFDASQQNTHGVLLSGER